MKSAGNLVSRIGFTLIEVIVALAIAATAIVMLLRVNHESMARSLSSREHSRLTDLAQSKWESIQSGLETSTQGQLELPGWNWKVEREELKLDGLQSMERVTFLVLAPGSGVPRIQWHSMKFKGLPKL